MVGFTVEVSLKEDHRQFRMLGLLIVGGIAGNMLSTVLARYTLGVGASGCVYSMLGALIVWYWLRQAHMGGERGRFLLFMLILNGVTFAFSFFTQTTSDAWAHLGGLLVGIPLGYLNVAKGSAADERKLTRYRKHAIAALASYFLVMSLLILFLPMPRCYGEMNCGNVFCI